MFKLHNTKKRIFMDYASTTPLDKDVLKKMSKFFTDDFYNTQALYTEGLKVRKVLQDSRELVANLVGTKPDEIIFTGGGTESDNLAIIGVCRAIYEKIKKENHNFKPHILTTNIEHVAVLESFEFLSQNGFDVEYIEVNKDGLIDAVDVKNKIRKETVLISIMYVNNEIGTIFPIREIANIIERFKKENGIIKSEFPYLHTDASQAPNYLDINLNKLKADLVTLDGSKIYGPKGVGCLIKKNYVPIIPINFGGKHEFGFRAGTVNLPLIFGFSLSLKKSIEMREKEVERLSKIQKYFFEELKSKIPEAVINGSEKDRIANNVNFCIKGLNGEFAVIFLDENGVCCSSTTACRNFSDNASSYVVGAINKDCSDSSLRFTFGRKTTKKDVDFVIGKLIKLIENKTKK